MSSQKNKIIARAHKRKLRGIKFRSLCTSVAKQLSQNDSSLSQDEAFRQARKLVKLDWKEDRRVL